MELDQLSLPEAVNLMLGRTTRAKAVRTGENHRASGRLGGQGTGGWRPVILRAPAQRWLRWMPANVRHLLGAPEQVQGIIAGGRGFAGCF